MYEKAVVCTDLTAESDDLVACAGGLRAFGLNTIVLAHVVDVFSSVDVMLSDRAEAAFARQIETLENLGFRVHIEAPMGHPVFSLRNLSREHGASLIVVASHGTGVFSTPFSGDVPSDLVALSETPVFVAAPCRQMATGKRDCGQVLSNVLYATDFSKSAENAFETTLGLVGLDAQAVTVLHIQDVERLDNGRTNLLPEYDRKDIIRLERMRERLAKSGAVDVSTDLAHGKPAEEMAKRTASGEYSLVVMGSRGRSRRDTILGGVSGKAVEETQTPILIVPAQSDDSHSEPV